MNVLEQGIPTVPLRGMVVYPDLVIHLDIGREKSIRAVEAAMEHDRILAVVAQKDDDIENPTIHEVGRVGTLVKIKQMLRLPGGIVRILVEGISISWFLILPLQTLTMWAIMTACTPFTMMM